MARIKGIEVTLYVPTIDGYDPFGEPILDEEAVKVENVLVYPSSPEEVLETTNLYGKKAVYTLAIPKGDTNIWQDRKIGFYGELWRSFGIPIEGIEDNIPLSWNKKVMVERFE